MKSFPDFTDGKIGLLVYQIVDRIQVLPGQLSLAAPLIDTKVYTAGLFHLLAQAIDRPQTDRKILGCLFGVVILFKRLLQ